MAKKDRVYTKRMGGAYAGVLDTELFNEYLADTWTTQEDIKIIGWFLDIHLDTPAAGWPTADGAYWGSNELTFAAKRNQDAAFANVNLAITRMVFGSPASGAGWIQAWNKDRAMLPAGNYIEAKEGEIINFFMEGRNDTGGTRTQYGEAYIYYTKG